jgi:predicted lysophospholipase L1 biosynthesis ABC-type transport system permease subunit
MRSQGAAVVVSESLARQLFPGEDALGKRVPSIRLTNGIWKNIEIVGIAGDTRLNNIRWDVDPTAYTAALAMARPVSALEIRTGIDPERVMQPVRQAITTMNPRALVSIRPMDDVVNRSIARERMVAATSGFFGLVGLVLAGIGVFSVAACTVSQRTKELGLRMALGASPWKVIRESLRETVWVFGLGLIVGTAAAVAGARSAGSLVSGLLFGLTATDWSNVAAAALLMVAVGITACLAPAIRATRVDPLDALRHE